MKEIKELKFEELTTKQKLGIVHTPLIHRAIVDGGIEYILEKIREHAIGIVWVQWSDEPKDIPFYTDVIRRIREAADYPIVIITDLEAGIGDYRIGQHSALGTTDSEKHAYAFGKATAVEARARGYDMVCHPVLDARESGWSRGYSDDKYKITRLAAAETRGLHDGGLLTMAKHYPSVKYDVEVDTHLTEGISSETKEQLLENGLYPYLELMKEGLLDGIMTAHERLVNIDADAPASMSKKVLGIIREQGFDGVLMTDALCMMGIREKYGRKDCLGIALEAGNDVPLYYAHDPKFDQEALYECYERGIISDATLDAAVKRILALQHKALLNRTPKYTSLTEEEIATVKSIDRDGIFAVLDEGTPLSLDPNGKYFFALMVRFEHISGLNDKVAVDTFSNGWYYPKEITAKIKELFPNSHVEPFCEFPMQGQNSRICTRSLGYDGIVFVTFSEFLAYMGMEHFTHRVISLTEALQHTNRIGTLVHFGNPKVVEELPHISRRIFAPRSAAATRDAFEVLAGNYPAKGKPNYKLNLK